MTSLQRNRGNMPPDFEPPAPAWAATWGSPGDALTTALFACQGGPAGAFEHWVEAALRRGEPAPAVLERATFTDLAGLENRVAVAYWHKADGERWAASGALDWWQSDDRLDDGCGYWREVFSVPAERLETLHSTPNRHGVAQLARGMEGPVEEHAYPGAMRDRIPVSGRTDLRVAAAIARPGRVQESAGGRRIVVTPPANMCVIRSGQDWTHCDDEETRFYVEKLRPKLEAGMDYLSRNPEESRCLCMRLMTHTAPDGAPQTQTFGLGYASDIFAFEEWAKSHPTHVEIFGHFMTHAERFGERMNLRLWHEVSVLEAGAGEFEYIGCHPHTGLLRTLE